MDRSTLQLGEDGDDERLQKAEAEERAALARIILAFRDYQQSAEWEVARWQSNLAKLPPHHKALVPGQAAKLAAARAAIQTNAFFIKALLQAFDPDCATGPLPPHLALPLEAEEDEEAAAGGGGGGGGGDDAGGRGGAGDGDAARQQEAQEQYQVNANDVDKVRYVLKNLARDWSAEGAAERMMSYGRILEELKLVFKDWSDPHRPPRVLIPGAGLARLCVEVAGLGYEAQGNEFSYFMLLASSFILNHTSEVAQFTVHPWLHSNCNHLTDADQLRPVAVPDVVPGEVVAGPGLLSMCAGDFVEVYSAPDMRGLFDCVVTCFFIDTAHNVLRYLEVISHCLAPGGTWINLGPLLYHWADAHTYLPTMELSIELSLEDIREAAQTMGFRLVREESLDVPYMADYRSMFKTVYQAVFWRMVKEREWEPPAQQQPPPPPPPPRSSQPSQPSQPSPPPPSSAAKS
ncbi:hypothetical protein PLESTB_000458200 [Pleodorina starrii]|uniref:carnosine N-methyltransferase n=1 Tax=Pleodorina starrii TaxID=330485 RepID=A0A9W6EZG3_9CHLO|nr:hypothetical protein PLESTM_000759800 [Pleodorina starrii]GLC51028.1 hypothetical protein PLESTB_000458200 [Pleodorina starrii]